MPSPALTIATAAAAAAVPKNLWASLLAHGYSATLLTHPFQLKTLTSMFVNPIGGAIGQIMKDGKITSWREIRLFMVWGLGLGGPLPFPQPHPTPPHPAQNSGVPLTARCPRLYVAGPSAHVWNEILQRLTDRYKWNLAVKLLVDHYIWKELLIYLFCW